MVEVAVGGYLGNEAIKYGLDLYYWKQGNLEVDFILCKGLKIVAIEVKSGKRSSALPGLEYFIKQNKTARALTVGGAGLELKNFLEPPVLEWFN